jgi:hypothetical protein
MQEHLPSALRDNQHSRVAPHERQALGYQPFGARTANESVLAFYFLGTLIHNPLWVSRVLNGRSRAATRVPETTPRPHTNSTQEAAHVNVNDDDSGKLMELVLLAIRPRVLVFLL